jgi:pantoate--beta-alanine ligase
MKEVARKARARGRKIGFVPTMGALHEGHMSLVRRVKELCEVTVVSIFVNPLQFGPGEDLERYPRTLSADVDACIAEGVDYVFAPSAEEMEPAGAETRVELPALGSRLEGRSRPGHFTGVATVVLKLLNIVQPHMAAFGQKDAQQCAVVRRLAADLMLDVELLVLPIVRDEHGLALSSRNRWLTEQDRERARLIPRALEAGREVARDGGRQPQAVIDAARAVLEEEPGLEIDYVELVDAESFESVEQLAGEMLLLVAVRLGDIRLIDNTVIRL